MRRAPKKRRCSSIRSRPSLVRAILFLNSKKPPEREASLDQGVFQPGSSSASLFLHSETLPFISPSIRAAR